MTATAAVPGRHLRRSEPLYQRIADDLLQRIEHGEFEDGRLPNEQQLQTTYQASSTTVRSAVAILVEAGVVETRHGVGSFVVTRHLTRINATFTEDLGHRSVCERDAWSTDIIAAGRRPRQRFECLNVAAATVDAEILGCDPDDPLVMRRCWRYVDDVPASIEASLFPGWLVDELPRLASPQDIVQGTTSFCAANGHPMVVHRDTLSARPLTRDEAQFFGTGPALGVLARTRVSYGTDRRVLRVANTVYRADMHEVVYEVPGRGNPTLVK